MTESVKSDLNAFSAEDDDQLVIGLREGASPSLWGRERQPFIMGERAPALSLWAGERIHHTDNV
jgi:hypothetical protein